MNLVKRRMERQELLAIREQVLNSWPTGKQVDFDEGVRFHRALPEASRFGAVLRQADRAGKVLIQPRAGVALVDEHIRLLQGLEEFCDLLPTTIDAYTRQNRYEEAAKGIEKSKQAGQSLLNGFPAVNHGLSECRRVVTSLKKPVQVRHGTPDARLLAEITLAAGFTAYEGGGISYNIPYTKKVPLEKSLRDWQYVDRLVGEYEDNGVRINREPFGPLSGTLVPPCVSHTVALIEGLLALQQGVKSITLGYGQAGNLVQDVAAIASLRELAHEYFQAAGFADYELTTVFHQWMGGFPENESKAFAVIAWGATTAALARATKVIVKTPHEARGIPTRDANRQGLDATRQVINMLSDQPQLNTAAVDTEKELIKREVRGILKRVLELGNGDLLEGTVRAFAAGVIDVPFAPSVFNLGRMMPVRDNEGAVRIFAPGQMALDKDVLEFHRAKVQERAKAEGREPVFQMVIDDIYAVSKGRLVGRPR
ncbi:MAG: methylaspartate mutase subunit E [Lentisphaerae bacterium RIFOXYB12_FULL_65_16]|nr:MAG: methylaspartate mutase subunit E [Lentisphaerae bacterium RIFOXYA12_64_32]OGV86443.1 MAG: methylaspartate mutase subunit E [Lentisphaerae bacterium RIFOXYB12_FULL_65_16]